MLIYDIEIKKAILGKREKVQQGVEYCEGWHDHAGMGISVICAYDYAQDRWHTFCDDNFDAFQRLVDSTNLVIGYNSISFDNKVCRAHGLMVPDEKSYDILVEIWKAAGLSPTFNFSTHLGYSLDAVIKANFPDVGKTGSGAMAPVFWQQGKIGTVVDYCLADVWLTKMLLDRIRGDFPLVSPKTGQNLHVETPDYFLLNLVR
jgi:hypothetical protein